MKYKSIHLPTFTLLFGVTHDVFGLKNGASADAPDLYSPHQPIDTVMSWAAILAVSAALAWVIILLIRRVEKIKAVSKNIKRFSLNTRLKKIIATSLLIGIVGFLAWHTFLRPALTEINMQGYALDGPTYVVKGKVTRKQTSCGLEILGTDGMARQGGGICDGGNSLEVDGVQISTGGGALEGRPPKYISDIGSIHAGDSVEVHYAKDGSGYASTNCKSCYVKKL